MQTGQTGQEAGCFGGSLGGIARVTFQINAASLLQDKLMRAIEMLGTRVAPVLHEELASTDGKAVW